MSNDASLVIETIKLMIAIATCILSMIYMIVMAIHRAIEEHRAKQAQKQREMAREMQKAQRDLERGEMDRRKEFEVKEQPAENLNAPTPHIDPPQIPPAAHMNHPSKPTSYQAPKSLINV